MDSFNGKRRARAIAAATATVVAGALAWAYVGLPAYSQSTNQQQGTSGTAGGAAGTAGAPGVAGGVPATATPTSSPTATTTATPRAGQDIVGTLTAAGNYKTLLQALQSTGLTASLQDTQSPVTIMAPTDEAFSKMPQNVLAQVKSDPALLKELLQYHLIAGDYSSEQLSSMGNVQSVEGDVLTFTTGSDGALHVNNAKIVDADREASNGTIDGIDTVLLPPALAGLAPTATATPTGTATAVATDVPGATGTPVATATPVPEATATATPSPSPSASSSP